MKYLQYTTIILICIAAILLEAYGLKQREWDEHVMQLQNCKANYEHLIKQLEIKLDCVNKCYKE